MKIEIKNDSLFITPDPNIGHTPIQIKQTREQYDDELGSIRLYQHYVGDSTKNENGFTLQIRAFQSLDDRNKTVKRNIIATARISDSEIMALADYVTKKREKYNTFLKSN